MTERVVVITGAVALPRHVVAAIPPDALVIAVDGGLDHARAAGIAPDHLVGDLDSITDAGLAWATEHIEITRHPTDKDQTDTQLALRRAIEHGAEHVTMIGGGDRLDHTLAAIGALAAPHLAVLARLDAWWDGQHLTGLHAPRRVELDAPAGSTVSVVAIGGAPAVVSIAGVKWPLDHHELRVLDGLGVSNEVLGGAAVEAHAGVLAVFDVVDVDPDATTIAHRQEDRPT